MKLSPASAVLSSSYLLFASPAMSDLFCNIALDTITEQYMTGHRLLGLQAAQENASNADTSNTGHVKGSMISSAGHP